MPVDQALVYLQFLPKKAAKILLKLVKGATANANDALNISSDQLVVKTVEIGRGPKLKRFRSV